MNRTKVDEIADLLEREREALRIADFGALRTLAEEKERLVGDMGDKPIGDAETLGRLRDMAARNENLLAAVRQGVDSAARIIGRRHAPAEPLDTYDHTGQRTRIGDKKGSLTRRA